MTNLHNFDQYVNSLASGAFQQAFGRHGSLKLKLSLSAGLLHEGRDLFACFDKASQFIIELYKPST